MTTPLALVTGASRGIGKAIALKLAHNGFHVLALARTTEALNALVAEAPKSSIEPLALDMGDLGSVEKALGTLSAREVSVLVNNAGIAPSSSLAKTTLAEFQQVQAVNLAAPFLFCRAFMPAMAARGAGRVVNIASTAAFRGYLYTAAYCASKHALLGLTRSLALEYAAKKVTINAVCPGWTDTDMLSSAVARIEKKTGRSADEAKAAIVGGHPLGRAVSPAEVAEVVAFLTTSPGAAAINGAAYIVDGAESV